MTVKRAKTRPISVPFIHASALSQSYLDRLQENELGTESYMCVSTSNNCGYCNWAEKPQPEILVDTLAEIWAATFAESFAESLAERLAEV